MQIGMLAVEAPRRRGDRGAVIEEIEAGGAMFQLGLAVAFDGGLIQTLDLGHGAVARVEDLADAPVGPGWTSARKMVTDKGKAVDGEGGSVAGLVLGNGAAEEVPACHIEVRHLENFHALEDRRSQIDPALIGEEAALPVVEAEAVEPFCPPVGKGLAASVGSTNVDLTWNASTDTETGVAGYYVYRDATQIANITTKREQL